MIELIFVSYALFGLGYAIAYRMYSTDKNIWVFIILFMTWPAAIGYTFGVKTLGIDDNSDDGE